MRDDLPVSIGSGADATGPTCRGCSSSAIRSVLDLGDIPASDLFPVFDDPAPDARDNRTNAFEQFRAPRSNLRMAAGLCPGPDAPYLHRRVGLDAER